MVWGKKLHDVLNLDKAEAVSNKYTTEDVTAVIGISGKLEGSVLYGFSDDTSINVVKRLIDEDLIDPRSELGLSALGEIANMISGNAATALAAMGYQCNISPPVMIEPAGSRFTTLAGPQILVSFSSEVGSLTVRISLYEKS